MRAVLLVAEQARELAAQAQPSGQGGIGASAAIRTRTSAAIRIEAEEGK